MSLETWSNLEGDDQVHLLAHSLDEFGSQMARQADLWMLWMEQQRRNKIREQL